jgi:hypothetical protein
MPVNEDGTKDRNTQDFKAPPNPHLNDADEYARSMSGTVANQAKQDGQNERAHENSIAAIQRLHNRVNQKTRND